MIAPDVIVGIDVGTTKICTLVAKLAHDGELSIAGIGKVPSYGLRKGTVTDIKSTIESIHESKILAEQTAGLEIDSAFIGVTGSHIEAHLSNAIVSVSEPQRGITQEDVDRAIDLAKRMAIPKGRRLIDVIVRDFIIDNQVRTSDPIGANGMRLEANVLLISASIPELESIYKAVNNAGIDVEDIIIQPIASAEAVLSADERDLGVALIDIGGGTTDLAVYQQGNVNHLAVFPVGGNHVNSDLACGIRVSAKQAEHIKLQLGGVGEEHISSTDLIEINRGGNRHETIPLKIISIIIYPRIEEILLLVRDNLENAGFLKQIPCGIVLTGGTALMPGITDLASKIFDTSARIGYPQDIFGLTEESRNPKYATAVGLVKIGSMEYLDKKRATSHSTFASALKMADNWGKVILRSLFR